VLYHNYNYYNYCCTTAGYCCTSGCTPAVLLYYCCPTAVLQLQLLVLQIVVLRHSRLC
jgi:hypothetical protein